MEQPQQLPFNPKGVSSGTTASKKVNLDLLLYYQCFFVPASIMPQGKAEKVLLFKFIK